MNNVTVTPEIIQMIPRIEPGGLALYCYLASLAAETGECSPCYEMIQEVLGISRGTIERYISLLRAAGLISTKRRFSASTVYAIVDSSLNNRLAIPLTTTTINRLRSKGIISPENRLMDNMTELPRFQTDEEEAFYVFAQVTGLMAFNSRTEQQDIKRLGAIIKQRGIEDGINYLKPFFVDWCKRKSATTGKPYNRMTTGWLDWAIGGEIPQNGKRPAKDEIFVEEYR
jgi:DNA-binding transcriptional ArsR family regulator